MAKNNIILIGFMGAGKSTVARALSHKGKYRVVDLDRLIEAYAGMSITDIFQAQGEAGFRDLEEAALRGLADSRSAIIAAGGGAVLRPGNRELMKQLGAVVYLRARWETLRRRLEGTTDRPLVNQARDADELRLRYLSRAPLYEQADVIVDTDDRPVDEIAVEILEKLGMA